MQKALFPGYTVGSDAYEDIVNICPAYGKRAAIIGGKHALAAAGDKIRQAVEGSGIEIIGTFWYGGEASRENMDMLRPQVAEADMLFAVGGGKAIDTCKVLSHETNRPFFTFPTIASTCAACTSLGIVYHPDGSLREYSFSKIPPNHIFINTEIIANAPVRYLWAGMGDTMAKHYECTISSRNDIPAHSDAMGIALSSMCAEPIVRWGGAGATVPLLGFGYSLARGVEKAVGEQGWLGVMTGGLSAAAGGIAAAVVFAVLMALLFKPGDKR